MKHFVKRNGEVDGQKLGVQDGDTIELESGNWTSALNIRNLPGTADKQVTITNSDKDEPVVLPKDKRVFIENCGFIRLKGKEEGGIVIRFRVQNGGYLRGVTFENIHMDMEDEEPGISIKQKKESDGPIELIEVINCRIKGVIHGGEALYLGSQKAKGNRKKYPIGRVNIMNNEFIGWGEGPQVRAAKKVVIKDNVLRNIRPYPKKVKRLIKYGENAGKHMETYTPVSAAIAVGIENIEVEVSNNTAINCGGQFLNYQSGKGKVFGNKVDKAGWEHTKYDQALVVQTNDRVEIYENEFKEVEGVVLKTMSHVRNVEFRDNVIVDKNKKKDLYLTENVPDRNIKNNKLVQENGSSIDDDDNDDDDNNDDDTDDVNIEALMKKYQKLSKSITKNDRRIGELEAQVAELETVIKNVRSLASEAIALASKGVVDVDDDDGPIPGDEEDEEAENKETVSIPTVADLDPDIVLWSTDHTTGDFSGWEKNQGRAIYNNDRDHGSNEATISEDMALSGKYSLKMVLDGVDGTKDSLSCRVFRRWIDSGKSMPLPYKAYYSAWYYFPEYVEVPKWWNIFQFKSKNDEDGSQPMFSFNVGNTDDGQMYLYIFDKANGEVSRQQMNDTIPLPIGQWVHIECFLKKDHTNNGDIIVWQDGVRILEGKGIRTLLNEGDRLHWSVNHYANHLIPSKVTIYVDDPAITTKRVSK